MDDRSDKLLSFLQEIEKCKIIERRILSSNLTRMESDAEHSWHVAMFLLLFEKDLPKDLNMMKMLKLALMHDLVEIYAGDTFAYDKENRATKKEREFQSAKKLFSKLPEDVSKEFFDLFSEYEEAKTPEAKMVKSFDKIQPILQNVCSRGLSWKEHSITFSEIDGYKRKFMEHDDFVLYIYEKVLDNAKKMGFI